MLWANGRFVAIGDSGSGDVECSNSYADFSVTGGIHAS